MTNPSIQTNVIEPPYFSNWADLVMPKLANKILPYAASIKWLTPNHVSVFAFFLYALGCVFLIWEVPYHFIYTAILLPIAYILDCLDGQLARATKQMSALGDYLDKTLDVLKIYIITGLLSFAVYRETQDILAIYLGFTACFFFNYRYYIKLETMFSATNKDQDYLAKSSAKRKELYKQFGEQYNMWSKTLFGKIKVFLHKNRAFVFVDEAEFVVFTSVAALLGRPEIALWAFAISQPIIAFWRLYERGKQITTFSDRLYWPMRK